jgi:transcriptional regulator with XRE-family HTH domain
MATTVRSVSAAVGPRIRAVRALRGPTQRALVDSIEPPMSVSRLVQVEKSYRHRPVTMQELRRIAKALDVAVDVLLNPLPALPAFKEAMQRAIAAVNRPDADPAAHRQASRPNWRPSRPNWTGWWQRWREVARLRRWSQVSSRVRRVARAVRDVARAAGGAGPADGPSARDEAADGQAGRLARAVTVAAGDRASRCSESWSTAGSHSRPTCGSAGIASRHGNDVEPAQRFGRHRWMSKRGNVPSGNRKTVQRKTTRGSGRLTRPL